MSKFPDLALQAIWESAEDQPLGLVLRTNSPPRAKAALYAWRARHAPRFDQFQIRTAPAHAEGEDLWISKSGTLPLLDSPGDF